MTRRISLGGYQLSLLRCLVDGCAHSDHDHLGQGRGFVPFSCFNGYDSGKQRARGQLERYGLVEQGRTDVQDVKGRWRTSAAYRITDAGRDQLAAARLFLSANPKRSLVPLVFGNLE